MKKLDKIKSVTDISYADYLNYTDMMSAKNLKPIGVKEVLYLLPIVAGFGCLGLLSISAWFTLLAMPLICVGVFFASVAGHSIYVNFCKRADAKLKLKELKRLKHEKQLSRISNLMQEYESSENFQVEKLLYEIENLKNEIKTLSSSTVQQKENVLDLKTRELLEKEYVLNLINKNKSSNSSVKKYSNKTNLTNDKNLKIDN